MNTEPFKCLICGSKSIEKYDQIYDTSAITTFDQCLDCGASWENIWRFEQSIIEEQAQ